MCQKHLVWLILAVCGLVYVIAQIELWDSKLHGDEPHVLMTSISIIKDWDLNIYPSYLARYFVALGYSDLAPQVSPVNGFIPPEKGIGFPAFVAPLYAAFGLQGTRIALLAINALAFPLLFLNCVWTGLSRIRAALACLALATVMPWVIHAGMVIPEAFAGTIVIGIVGAYLRFKQTDHWAYAFGVGLLTVLLPIIYLKYAALAAASAVLLLANRRLRIHPATYAAAPLAAAYALLWITVYGYSIAIGTGGGPGDFNPTGIVQHFWYAFIDRQNGEWVWAPVTVLAVAGLLWWHRPCLDVQAYLVAAVVLYATLYGLTTLAPGDSAPGRYLVAAVPAMVMLAALGMLRDGAIGRTRVAVFGGLMLLSAIILYTSIAAGRYELPSAYAIAFPKLY